MSKISYPQLVKDVADAVRVATDTTDLIKVGDLATIISELGAKMGDVDFWYKSITYNEDDTITLIDQNDVEHIIVCTYESGKMVKVTYDGAKLDLDFDGVPLIQISETEIDITNAPTVDETLYKSMVYNEDGTVTITDSDGTIHTMVCEYDDERVVGLTYDGEDIKMSFRNGNLVGVDEMEIDISSVPTMCGTDTYGQYLESNGAQYIDLGIKARSGLRIHLDVNIKNLSQYQAIFGSQDVNDTNRLSFYLYQNLEYYYYYGTGNYPYKRITNNLGNYRVLPIDIEEHTLYIGEYKIGGSSQSPFVSTQNMFLFARNTQGTVTDFANVRIFRFSIYDINDNNKLIMDLIPAVSTESGHKNEACMFDRVTEKYFYNLGDGAFTLSSIFPYVR